MTIFDSIAAAEIRRDVGIARAAGGAGEDWAKRARGYLLEYLATNPAKFLTEDWREWAVIRGLDSPRDGRAYGCVIQAAKRDGLVRFAGFCPARSSNMSPKCAWEPA